MLRQKAIAGFTLIEVLVGVSILGVLLAVGLPAFGNYMGNAKLRASAASFHTAAQFARSESIRRNGGVEILLTDTAPTDANIVPSASGRNWVVRWSATGAAPYTLLQGKSIQEGNAASSVIVTGNVDKVAFSGMGGVVGGAAASFKFTSANGCADASG